MSEQEPVEEETVTAEVFPLLWVDDVAGIADWAIASLGLSQAWRAANDDGHVEHAELLWSGGRVSINVKREQYAKMGPAGISLRLDSRSVVDNIHARAVAAGANIIQGPEESPIAYSFTALDPAGNQWWVNAETGFLDKLRSAAGTND